MKDTGAPAGTVNLSAEFPAFGNNVSSVRLKLSSLS